MTSWVDDFLLAGPDDEVCLQLGGPVRRSELRTAVAGRQNLLRDMGVGPVHSVAMQQPASLDHVATALAVWRLGAQLVTVDHRVTRAGFDDVLAVLRPKAVVTVERISQRPVWTPRTDHVLVQVTSGSTGAPKLVGRTFTDIVAEVVKTGRLPGMPGRGESAVVLAAFAHTYGLFAGLLHGLHSGARVVVPEHPTARGIATAVAEASGPATVFGVPFHLRLLASLNADMPGLARVVSSGERIEPVLGEMVASRLNVPVGQIYGMTETGMIAGDLDGSCRPSVGRLAPGVDVRTPDGELQVRMDASPYLGFAEAGRWQAGWFRTGDAASAGPGGLLTLHGRMDAQVTVGGLKVDLTSVESILSALPGVADAVVVNDGVLKAFVVLREGGTVDTDELDRVLAPHQRPRVVHTVSALPRTPSGKVVRALDQLNAAVLEGSLT
ncbi:long-chain fatty acid--CoA ligase [Lentzea tibetensis]|uniref:Long-chain fatty acid--CoA ligase n=1 Tax=Lentzea tibetensis TaxID=2591470 RepID=A0A563EMZ4_9PSEU|nr:fatty acid--CoA ligase family protein [Lentzea tibetensis]TWP48342.1 long-chain fatty acid--CoA ligase [Lentzea tibetensis]